MASSDVGGVGAAAGVPAAKRRREGETESLALAKAGSVLPPQPYWRLPELAERIAAGGVVGAKAGAKTSAARACAELLTLALDVAEQRPFILASSAPAAVGALFFLAGGRGREVAARTLGLLHVGAAAIPDLQKVAQLGASKGGLVPQITAMLRDSKLDTNVATLPLLASVAALPEQRRPLVSAGVVHLLLKLLAAAEKAAVICNYSDDFGPIDIQAEVARTLCSLASTPGLCDSIAETGAIRRLVALAQCGSSEGRLRSVLALRNLAAESTERREKVVVAGATPALLAAMRSEDQKEEFAAVLALVELASEGHLVAGLVQAGALSGLAEVLRKGARPESRKAAADVLKRFVTSKEVGTESVSQLQICLGCQGASADALEQKLDELAPG